MKMVICENNKKIGRSRRYGQLGRPGLLRWLEEATGKGTRTTRGAETVFPRAKLKIELKTLPLFPFS